MQNGGGVCSAIATSRSATIDHSLQVDEVARSHPRRAGRRRLRIGSRGARRGLRADLRRPLETGSATQLVTVVARTRSSTQGTLRLWTKRAGCWRETVGPWTAWLGGNGTSPAKREGDRRTPAGIFGFLRTMYGIATSPGVHYAYRRVVCGDWWVEDPASPYYNRFRHVRCGSSPPFRTTSEDLSRSPTAYRHFAVIAYNTDPVVPGRGSGVFFHVSTGGRRWAASASSPTARHDSPVASACRSAADRDRHDRRPSRASA